MDSRVRALYKIDPRPRGPAQARRIIAEELSPRVPPAVVEDVKLMVSELVTNGIVHRSSDEDVPVVLDVCINENVRCRVLDHGHGFASRMRDMAPGAGWGLRVVEALSDCWGMQCSPQRTEVWFEAGGS